MRITLGDLQTVVTTQSSVTVLLSEDGTLRGNDKTISDGDTWIINSYVNPSPAQYSQVYVFNPVASGKVVIIDEVRLRTTSSDIAVVQQINSVSGATALTPHSPKDWASSSIVEGYSIQITTPPFGNMIAVYQDYNFAQTIPEFSGLMCEEGKGFAFGDSTLNSPVDFYIKGRSFDI